MTDDVDKWLEQAQAVTARRAGTAPVREIHRRLDARAASALALRWRDVRLAVVCAALSAAVTLWTSAQFTGAAFAGAKATWIAMPSAVSPYGLLIGQ